MTTGATDFFKFGLFDSYSIFNLFFLENFMKYQFLALSAIAFLGITSSLAQATPVNVAQLYGTASASDTYSTNVPSQAIDGNDATTWVTYGGSPLEINLGQSFLVSKISLLRELSNGQYYGDQIPYNLYSSLDGTNWGLIGSDTFINEVDDRDDYIYSSGLSMQYVKYQATGGSSWVGLAEVQIFAEQNTPLPVSEPASIALLGLGLAGLGLIRRRQT